ncbi:MAG: hypothetical protein E7446_08225 [Ruminococcaceae bacterium]|nr:hypothetical protein [Oscillospiraceae bacterium]
MRPDGKRVKGLSPILAAMPYIMPKRYDAQNTITEYIDEEIIKQYIRQKRREGKRLDHMSVIMAAYYKAYLKNPKVNYFVMNRKIYERNHFCVSFMVLKNQADGKADQTALKVFIEKNDNIFKLYDRMQKMIELNTQSTHANNTDKFASFMLSLPVLPRFVLWLATLLDHYGLLPRFIIDLSPFHTSLFITNLASIRTSYIHHHCYEFGTTGVFICMGKPVADFVSGNYDKKLMPLGIVMDERFCSGHEFAAFCSDFRRYLTHPELLEENFDGSVDEFAEEKEPASV